jgi:hypothetical protein
VNAPGGTAPGGTAQGRAFGRLRAWARTPETIGHGGLVWGALVIGLFMLLAPGAPRPGILLSCTVLLATLLISLRFQVAPLAVIVMAVAGLGVRIVLDGSGFSDVLTVTSAAIAQVLNGHSPWGVLYPESVPPGAPFPYGPIAIFWYLPFRETPRIMELAGSGLILVLLALRGRPLGLAIFAFAPALGSLATDGSNDTSASLLILAASLVLQRSVFWGGVALAYAAAFKIYALAWLPALLWWGGLSALIGFGTASLVVWGPALLAWGPGAFMESFTLSQSLHAQAYYSLGYALQGVGVQVDPGALERLRLVLGGIVAVVGARLARTGRAVVVAGLAVYLVTLYAGWWSTFSYLAAIAPLVCWHLEDWVGLGERRVRWPGDPVGRVSGWVDARWPLLAGARRVV